MTGNLPAVASMWIGAPLSYVEIVCLTSFRDAGHPITLFVLDPLENVPEGITLRDAREILPPPFETGPLLRHNNAVYSDIFRLHLMRREGVIWVDADAYCLRPLVLPGPYAFAYERNKGALNVATGILGLPQVSAALRLSTEFVDSDCPVPDFFAPQERARLEELKQAGHHWRIENLTWGSSGPMLLDHFLRQTGEISHALPPDAFYPGPRAFRRPLLRVPPDLKALETPETLSVHVFGKTKRFLLADHGGLPPEGSYMDLICRRHGVDPQHFPIAESEGNLIGRKEI